ncbi:PEP-CTERM sorting domain-containing protein [Aphanothece sacrum]|uniref:PhoX protein n=1 Tax=Aphanothece sacrum FPU1 TaxID=1920663 RepID=A0A401IBK2_APHSA|nr:PEP-CTERM sorting domain-containing protein [Aphanothece sacrum]GBF78635.1 PhoX protein [Aphanothece sacrum FPU1]GBF84855.1 PhoX protein [Aphanothece sacrum FPU3]
MKHLFKLAATITATAGVIAFGANVAQAFNTLYPTAQIQGLNGWNTESIFTVGETIDGYTPTGILDGIGAIKINNDTVRVLVNSEIRDGAGASYTLNNGGLTVNGGARIHYFDIDSNTRTIKDAGLAFDRIFDRAGQLITNTNQFSSGASLNRFCSGQSFNAGTYGFVDNVYFAGEETSGGTQYVLDVDSISQNPLGGALYAAPALGLGAWENVTALEPTNNNQVALLLGDDRSGAPLYLYLGNKNAVGDNSFLDRNGLAQGTLHIWKADNGNLDASTFNGTASSRTGSWVAISNTGSGPQGYATQAELDAQTASLGGFRFSRPEDLSTNPTKGSQAVLASTGSSFANSADAWGTTYIIDNDLGNLTGQLSILYDGNEPQNRDFGLRSPDNLDWADDGNIYIQEDRAFSGFCQTSGEEASIWQVNPKTSKLTRIAQMNRSAVAPAGVTDSSPTDCGNWESSGILDVTKLFNTKPGEKLFILDIQAHSLRDGVIGSQGLVEGGQLIFASETIPEPLTLLGAGTAIFFGTAFKGKLGKGKRN